MCYTHGRTKGYFPATRKVLHCEFALRCGTVRCGTLRCVAYFLRDIEQEAQLLLLLGWPTVVPYNRRSMQKQWCIHAVFS